MEIFQTLWAALTTENKALADLVATPVGFLESFIAMLLFTTILNISASTKDKIKYVLIYSTLGGILGNLIQNPYRSFINLGIMFTCIKFIFNTGIVKTILATLIPILVSVLGESLFTMMAINYFNTNTILYAGVPIYRLLITLCIQLLTFIFYLLIRYSKIQISMLENMSRNSKLIFLLNLILATISIIIQFIITGFYIENLPIYIVILSNVSLIAYFLLSIYSLTKTTQYEVTSLQLEQEKENNRILQALQDDLRSFRHDFSNIMCTIGGFVQVKDMDGMAKYYSQIQKDVTKINNLGALNPDSINNPAVFTLIASKYSKALELGIEMNINVFLNLNTLNMKIYEFTRALGILLDNAIEAAKECDEKIINLEIRKESKRNRQILLIENTYNNKDVDTSNRNKQNFPKFIVHDYL